MTKLNKILNKIKISAMDKDKYFQFTVDAKDLTDKIIEFQAKYGIINNSTFANLINEIDTICDNEKKLLEDDK